MMVHDDGNGPVLWVGGAFTSAGGTSTNCLARWDGASWSSVGPVGIDLYPTGASCVYALHEHDDGTGSAIYVGGFFPSVGGAPGPYLARYRNGALETMPTTTDRDVYDLTSFGNRLVVGGNQRSAGGIPTACLSVWQSGGWHAVATGASPGNPAMEFCAHDDGTGSRLYAVFQPGQGLASQQSPLLRWQQGAWDPVLPAGTEAPFISSLLSADDGSGAGTSLFIGPTRSPTPGQLGLGLSRWDGSSLSYLGPGWFFFNLGDLASFDEGSGVRVFACGEFQETEAGPFHMIQRWNGSAWTPLDSDVHVYGERADAMCVHDDGTGPALYVGGSFRIRTGSVMTAAAIARWDGTSWSIPGGGISGSVTALVSHDDGTGPALYVAGRFSTAGGLPAANVARWKNGVWSALGAGLTNTDLYHEHLSALASFDDGNGAALYATGSFTQSGGTSLSNLARWNGQQWEPVGAGLGVGQWNSLGVVTTAGVALAVNDDGTGPSLWVGGLFATADSVVSNGIARLRVPISSGLAVCGGDGSGAACPCKNESNPGEGTGCKNSLGFGGRLIASGIPSVSVDTARLEGSQMPNVPCLYIQGSHTIAGGAGIPMGDGLRCVGSPIVRLGMRMNSGGASSFPARVRRSRSRRLARCKPDRRASTRSGTATPRRFARARRST